MGKYRDIFFEGVDKIEMDVESILGQVSAVLDSARNLENTLYDVVVLDNYSVGNSLGEIADELQGIKVGLITLKNNLY